MPQGLSGDEIAVAARISDVANQAVIFDLEADADATLAMVSRRAGGWFDPSVAEAFSRCGGALLREVGERDPWEAVLEAEPGPVATLEPLGRIAGLHHERLDGSGYHGGSTAGALSTATRLLATADVFQALTQPRPHRPARTPEQAAEVVADEAAAGRLDAECVRAIIDVAGQPARRVRSPWPAGLTDREVEVLRLLAAGRSNRQIADELVVSPRTAEHHVQHIYTKIGTSTRAAASLFAMEHGLLRY